MSIVGYVYDADGNQYPVSRIGNQYWMAENLNATCYIDGTPFHRDHVISWDDFSDNEPSISVFTKLPTALSGFSYIEPGLYGSFAIRNGYLYYWGINSWGLAAGHSFFDGDYIESNTVSISQIDTVQGWTMVKIHGNACIGIRNGRLYAWGTGTHHRGTGLETYPSGFQQVTSFTDWTHVFVAYGFAYGIRNNQIYVWGNWAQIPLRESTLVSPQYNQNYLLPTRINTNLSIIDAYANSGAFFIVSSANRIYATTRFDDGFSAFNHIPEYYVPHTGFEIQGFNQTGYFIRTGDYSWRYIGRTLFGEANLGDSRIDARPYSVLVTLSGEQLYSAFYSTFRISNNYLFATGRNNDGKLGVGTAQGHYNQWQVVGHGFTHVKTSQRSSIAIKNGDIYVCGYNGQSRLGIQNINPLGNDGYHYGRYYTVEPFLDLYPVINGAVLPTKQDWHSLIKFLNGKYDAFRRLRTKNTAPHDPIPRWPADAQSGNDYYGFNALPGASAYRVGVDGNPILEGSFGTYARFLSRSKQGVLYQHFYNYNFQKDFSNNQYAVLEHLNQKKFNYASVRLLLTNTSSIDFITDPELPPPYIQDPSFFYNDPVFFGAGI